MEGIHVSRTAGTSIRSTIDDYMGQICLISQSFNVRRFLFHSICIYSIILWFHQATYTNDSYNLRRYPKVNTVMNIESDMKSGSDSYDINYQVIVINLKSRTDRWKHMKKTLLKSSHFDSSIVHRHEAIVGKEVDLIKYYHEKKITSRAYRSLVSPRTIGGMFMTMGGLGCLLSHIELWKKSVELDLPIIAFEDDIELIEDFSSIFTKTLIDLPSDFGLFYFADMVNSIRSRRAATRIPGKSISKLNGEYWGTYAYMITPKVATILYENAFPLKYQVDSYIIETCHQYNISVYRSNINLVRTDNSRQRDSDVQHTPNLTYNQLIPYNFHIIQPFQNFHEQGRVASSNVKIWNDVELYLENDLKAEFDSNDVMYHIKLLRLQISILYDHGGIFLDKSTRIKHDLKKIIPIVGGIFAFHLNTTSTSIHYPLIAMRPGHTMALNLLGELDHIIEFENITPSNASQRIFSYIKKHSSRSPYPDQIIMYPMEILHDTGY